MVLDMEVVFVASAFRNWLFLQGNLQAMRFDK
jgi:hypothetical protein